VPARGFSLLLVLRSLAGRRTQSLLVACSIALAATVVAALLCLSIDVQRKVTEQLAEFGANAAFVPAGDLATFSASDGEKLAAGLPAASVVSPLLYARAEIETTDRKRTPVLVVGADPGTIPKVVKYRLSGQPLPQSGTLPSGKLPALVGSRLAADAGLAPTGQPHAVSLIVGDRRAEAEIVGVITTGESEDDQLLVPVAALEALSGLEGRRSAFLVRVPGRPEEVEHTIAGLRTRFAAAGIEAKLLRRVAATAAAALAKIRGLLTILSVVVVIASLLSAGTVLMEQAIERQGEVGLMISLGASHREVASLMLSEAGGLGLCGGLAGSLLGVATADVLERLVFRSPLTLPALVPPTVVLLGVLLAVAAAFLPLRASLAVAPAIALKEDRP
jgi:putative ABC transport system permease protein